jgi:hypothetical protein
VKHAALHDGSSVDLWCLADHCRHTSRSVGSVSNITVVVDGLHRWKAANIRHLHFQTSSIVERLTQAQEQAQEMSRNSTV